jgi:predicted nucleotidyltransferase
MANLTVITHEMPQKHEVIFSSAISQKAYKFTIDSLPDTYKKDIQKAVEILKYEGCKNIYLFGSLVTGNFNDRSDIDIGVEGLAPEKFFSVYGKLGINMNNVIDLVDFDFSKDFFEIIKKHKEIIEIG